MTVIYDSAGAIDFSLPDLGHLVPPRRVLLTQPVHFDVVYAINVHMEGNVGTVDRNKAMRQWEQLYEAYASIGLAPMQVQDAPGLPDMVFCANQTLPFLRVDGSRGVVLSRMSATERKDEVGYYEDFFAGLGYDTLDLPTNVTAFEGMGDALWHPRRRLLWGGYGIRSDRRAYDWLAGVLDTPVLVLHLDDPDFYHLDTCLCPLDETTAMYCPSAFDEAGRGIIEKMFRRLIVVPDQEARKLFACNAHCPDGETVLIQRGCDKTVDMLGSLGYRVVELDTSEFLKAGGSVFCMKQMFW